MEDGTKRDRLGRRRVPSEQREALLAEFERSGLTQAAFARKAGINYQTFASWRQHRGASESKARREVPTMRFTEVTLPPALSSSPTAKELSVQMPDGVVIRGEDPAQVAQLIRALKVHG